MMIAKIAVLLITGVICLVAWAAHRAGYSEGVKAGKAMSFFVTKKKANKIGEKSGDIGRIATDLEQAIKAGEGNKQQGGKG